MHYKDRDKMFFYFSNSANLSFIVKNKKSNIQKMHIANSNTLSFISRVNSFGNPEKTIK